MLPARAVEDQCRQELCCAQRIDNIFVDIDGKRVTKGSAQLHIAQVSLAFERDGMVV
jgi:hypothetical protein